MPRRWSERLGDDCQESPKHACVRRRGRRHVETLGEGHRWRGTLRIAIYPYGKNDEGQQA